MRALNNLRKIVPNWFNDYIDSNRLQVEICQIVEFPGWFQVLTYDVAEDCYYVGSIAKPKTTNAIIADEHTLFEESEMVDQEAFENEDITLLTEFEIQTLEQYANYVFARSLGIEGL